LIIWFLDHDEVGSMDVMDAIRSRRSIGRMTQDEPPREVIEQLIDAAVEAPNHYDSQPWRFYVLTGKAREDLGDVLAETLKTRWRGDESKMEAGLASERAKPMRSPVMIVVGVKHTGEDDRIIPREDLQAASAGIQNLMLAAHSLGLSCVWRTGDGAYDDVVKAHFGLEPRDEIAGMVYVGYPDPESVARVAPRARTSKGLTEWRNGA
jgi:nitroreductase